MSHLAEELERQLAQSSQSIDDIAAKTSISRAQLYLWKRSEQLSISDEQLRELAPALSDEIQDHAALVRAHLLDERFGPGCELVSVELDTPSTLRDRPKPRSKGERAMVFLQEERHRNPDLNDLLIDLARVLGADLEGKAVNSGTKAAGAAALKLAKDSLPKTSKSGASQSK